MPQPPTLKQPPGRVPPAASQISEIRYFHPNAEPNLALGTEGEVLGDCWSPERGRPWLRVTQQVRGRAGEGGWSLIPSRILIPCFHRGERGGRCGRLEGHRGQHGKGGGRGFQTRAQPPAYPPPLSPTPPLSATSLEVGTGTRNDTATTSRQ